MKKLLINMKKLLNYFQIIQKPILITIVVLNIAILVFEISYFYSGIRIEPNYQNLQYLGIGISLYLVFLLLAILVKHKSMEYLLVFLQSVLIIVLFYLFSFNLSCLVTSIINWVADKDLAVSNNFFKIYIIYSPAYLFEQIDPIYMWESKIKAHLTYEIKMRILGEANTMEALQKNVTAYCKKENEIHAAIQKSVNYKINNIHPGYLLGIGSICLLFVGCALTSDYSGVNTSIKSLIESMQELIIIDATLISKLNFEEKRKILTHLGKIFKHLVELKRNLK